MASSWEIRYKTLQEQKSRTFSVRLLTKWHKWWTLGLNRIWKCHYVNYDNLLLLYQYYLSVGAITCRFLYIQYNSMMFWQGHWGITNNLGRRWYDDAVSISRRDGTGRPCRTTDLLHARWIASSHENLTSPVGLEPVTTLPSGHVLKAY